MKYSSTLPKFGFSTALIGVVVVTMIVSMVCSGASGEPTPAMRPSSRSAEVVLMEAEITVLTRHYEKTMTEHLDHVREMRLLQAVNEAKERPPELESRLRIMELRDRALMEWQEHLRREIEVRVSALNEREAKRTEAERVKPSTAPSEKALKP